jgi:hypothetical protein
MVHFQKDYLYGLAQEQKILPILQDHFGKELVRNQERWGKYDFYTDKSYFELKSRTNRKDAYPTTLITCNKVIPLEDKELYFLFNFVDELSYIKYDPVLFDTFERKKFSRINQAYDEKDYFYIPIQHLGTIIKYIPSI